MGARPLSLRFQAVGLAPMGRSYGWKPGSYGPQIPLVFQRGHLGLEGLHFL